MIEPELLRSLFAESYTRVKEHTDQIEHAESIRSPMAGANCMHWIVGHIVVARCNFLMMLDVPSIWDWSTCEFFIPGSAPSAEAADRVGFARILADLDRTQNQLLAVLERVSASDLEVVKDDRAIGEHLLGYAVHEAYHAGQLEALRPAMGR